MRGTLLITATVGLLLGMMPAPTVNAMSHNLVTQKTPLRTYVRINGKTHWLWNQKHTKVITNLRNHPKTTWKTQELLTLHYHGHDHIFAVVTSANHRYHGLIWHGYLKPGNFYNDFKTRYHAQQIRDGINQGIMAKRMAKTKENNRLEPNMTPARGITVISSVLNRLDQHAIDSLTRLDYRVWQAEERKPHYERLDRVSNTTWDRLANLDDQMRQKYHLAFADFHEYGYANLNYHPTQKTLIAGLVDRFTRPADDDSTVYFGDGGQQVLYLGSAVKIDVHKKLVYAFVVYGVPADSSEPDYTINPALK